MPKRVYDKSESPLALVLDSGGHSGYTVKDIWVRDVSAAEFIIYGSHDGKNWRQIDELQVPHGERDNRHKGLSNAYRYIKVTTSSETESEIEIVAGVWV